MEQFYQNNLIFIRKYPLLEKIILLLITYCPFITFGIYPCLLLYLYISHDTYFLEALLRPLFAFLFVTIFRHIINRPRPYDKMNIQPLKGHKHGQSFPSRHTLSAFVIALTCLHVNIYLGIFTLIIACIISLTRILAGIHYISDVAVAIMIAIISYIFPL
ncbi:MAG: phosphatase PAP2 family protein [Erysipelotrichaceae bacterium]|nr:phosphatase PAP2 family protein [Erysipelotrichaceae bacterium]